MSKKSSTISTNTPIVSSTSNSKTELILAIDPAESAGVALFLLTDTAQLLGAAPARGDRFKTLAPVIAKLVEGYESVTARTVIVESGWMGPSRGGHTLAKRRGIAEAAAEFSDFDKIEEAQPNDWRRYLWGVTPKRDAAKKLAMDHVREKYGFEPVTDDVAEAVCLGEYLCRIKLQN